jgi:methyl-accepting chemotaxis protein
MTIKSKLTFYAIVVIGMLVAVAATSFFGMSAVKGKLSYLTERSTPFQMRTVEFQRSLQQATAGLVKVGACRTLKEFADFKVEALASLEEVKRSQEVLETLAGGERMGAYDELSAIGRDLLSITEGRLKAEEQATAANRRVETATGEAVARLRELDTRIKGLQQSRSTAYSGSVRDTQSITNRMQSLERLRLALKDIQLALSDIQRAKGKSALLIAKGKTNAALSKARQNEFATQSRALAADLTTLSERFDELLKLSAESAGKADADRSVADAAGKSVSERLSTIQLAVEQEVAGASDRYGEETGRQGTIYLQSSLATEVLARNSELVALGISVEALTSRLFTASSERDITAVEGNLNRCFQQIAATQKSLDSLLAKAAASRERNLLQRATQALTGVRASLSAADGVIATVRNTLAMQVKATTATELLRKTVIAQAEKGKKSVSTAQGEQEKAIATVTRMVRTSLTLILGIAAGAVLFGGLFSIWLYRGISTPLSQLIKLSGEVAQGNLAIAIACDRSDEIGSVQRAMGTMIDNLRGMVGKILGVTGNLASSSERLSGTAEAMETGSQEQTVQIEQSATAITEMAQTTEEVAGNSNATSDAAVRMRKMAEEGQRSMQGTTCELEHFAGMVQQSSLKMEALGVQSEKIADIVTLIKDIADQTNLLALNAAIEAARAGEHGRGFAVVADNVRHLAERTAEATGEISATVKSMETSIGESVSYMLEERETVAKVVEHVKVTTQNIDAIVSCVEQVTEMVQRTAVAAEEQSATTGEVSCTMERISTITRDLKKSASEVRGSSSDLSHLALELKDMVGWFKV